ncbi:YacL family protein [Catenovulum sp. 2E275]|uniref:UPF0231 family protein n=1 Tax=Catenovulum sp. 2E275 TaxID=2980497 RepID=UPI0021CE72E3|nr:YacL family protein [Catenovulum sp. 2E275]MCU4674881.1 YacL family protein [Catenovulum sp. 2E275]
MEYDFYRTPDGLFEAEFSTEQEYFGHWLTYQLTTDKNQIVELLNVITQLKKRQLKEHKIPGAEYTLYLNQDEAVIQTNAKPVLKDDAKNLEEFEDDEQSETNADDSEVDPDLLQNGCGIDDFEKVIQAWLNFIQE